MRKTKLLVEELTVRDMKEVKLQRNLGRFRISWVHQCWTRSIVQKKDDPSSGTRGEAPIANRGGRRADDLEGPPESVMGRFQVGGGGGGSSSHSEK